MLRDEMGPILGEKNEVKYLLIWTRKEKLFPIFYKSNLCTTNVLQNVKIYNKIYNKYCYMFRFN
jgi:hypothetical protein